MIPDQRPNPPAPLRLRSLMAATFLLGAIQVWAQASSLERDFLEVPDTAKPWVCGWWLNGNVDERTITRDLEAMRRQGFGGLLLSDARGYYDDQNHVVMPPSKMEFMSPEWRRIAILAVRQAIPSGSRPGEWQELAWQPDEKRWVDAEVDLTSRMDRDGPPGLGRSDRELDVAAVWLRDDGGSRVRRRHPRPESGRRPFRPNRCGGPAGRRAAGRQDADAFLQRELGRRGAKLDARDGQGVRNPGGES